MFRMLIIWDTFIVMLFVSPVIRPVLVKGIHSVPANVNQVEWVHNNK